MYSGTLHLKRVLAHAALVFFWVQPLSVFAQQTVEVIIQGYQFQPKVAQIQVGDTVKWVNREKRTSHSVVLPSDQGGESERFFPDESWQRRFDTPGHYAYHCGPHPEMAGEVMVSAP